MRLWRMHCKPQRCRLSICNGVILAGVNRHRVGHWGWSGQTVLWLPDVDGLRPHSLKTIDFGWKVEGTLCLQ